MQVLALVSELMTQSTIAAAATRAGVTLMAVGTAQQLLAVAAKAQPALVVLDLSQPALDVGLLLADLRPLLAPSCQVVAFGPHVHKARLEAAAAAGCDRVLSRGQFHGQMDQLLSGASSTRSAAE